MWVPDNWEGKKENIPLFRRPRGGSEEAFAPAGGSSHQSPRPDCPGQPDISLRLLLKFSCCPKAFGKVCPHSHNGQVWLVLRTARYVENWQDLWTQSWQLVGSSSILQ